VLCRGGATFDTDDRANGRGRKGDSVCDEGAVLATKRISHKKAQKAQKEEKRETQLRSILNCVSASVVDFSFVLFVPFCG
jgi:hypothetical protein